MLFYCYCCIQACCCVYHLADQPKRPRLTAFNHGSPPPSCVWGLHGQPPPSSLLRPSLRAYPMLLDDGAMTAPSLSRPCCLAWAWSSLHRDRLEMIVFIVALCVWCLFLLLLFFVQKSTKTQKRKKTQNTKSQINFCVFVILWFFSWKPIAAVHLLGDSPKFANKKIYRRRSSVWKMHNSTETQIHKREWGHYFGTWLSW